MDGWVVIWIAIAIVSQVIEAYNKAVRESPIAVPPVGPVPTTLLNPPPAKRSERPAPPGCPADSLPASGPILDMYLAFEGYDSRPIAKLVPGFIGDRVTIVHSLTRPLRDGWCEYRYRLRGPESIIRALCAWLQSKGYSDLTAMW